MLYEDLIDEELAQIAKDVETPQRALEVSEIQVPLRQLMNACIIIDIAANVQTAIDTLIEQQIGAAPVVQGKTLRGIFSERDVLHKILNKQIGDLTHLPVEQFMIADPQTATPEDLLDTAILYMARGSYRHLPIVDEEHCPIGMVSIRDVISYLVEHFSQEVLTLPPQPIRDAMKTREGA